jgi:ribonucleoside-diphosphate reductase alpha chain
MYYYAMKESCELAKRDGAYSSFAGSPLSKGSFQFDLWGVEPIHTLRDGTKLDWESLRTDVIQYGVRNSLLLAPMPTASTAQILGNTECFEPYTSNIYTRRTLAGDFMVVNRHL